MPVTKTGDEPTVFSDTGLVIWTMAPLELELLLDELDELVLDEELEVLDEELELLEELEELELLDEELELLEELDEVLELELELELDEELELELDEELELEELELEELEEELELDEELELEEPEFISCTITLKLKVTRPPPATTRAIGEALSPAGNPSSELKSITRPLALLVKAGIETVEGLRSETNNRKGPVSALFPVFVNVMYTVASGDLLFL